MFTKVLVPTDFSAHAQAALDIALALLPDEGAELILVTVPEHDPNETDLRRWKGRPVGDGAPESVEQATRERLQALATEIGRDGLTVHEEFRWEAPGQAIVDIARDHGVDAIIMGSRGRSDLAGLILGSVSHRVLHTADRRVIVVR